MQRHSILFIEDNVDYSGFVVLYLSEHGFDVTTVATAADMFKEIENRSFDCYLVDLTLPDEDGIVLIRKLRARSSSPIIVLSGRKSVEDKLATFELGAEDYITKPVEPRELVLRLKAILSRYDDAGQTSEDMLHFGDFVLDHSSRDAHGRDGKQVNLTALEFSLLWVLAQADGKVLSRDTLIDAMSSGDGPTTFRAVDKLVSRTRKKLDKDAILTVSNAGYKCGWPVIRLS
ncbi:MAG: response regulator transcription factor [Rhodospirillales bacterium]|nr:response regulator transcription factor [Rhodospirillales bacterium]